MGPCVAVPWKDAILLGKIFPLADTPLGPILSH